MAQQAAQQPPKCSPAPTDEVRSASQTFLGLPEWAGKSWADSAAVTPVHRPSTQRAKRRTCAHLNNTVQPSRQPYRMAITPVDTTQNRCCFKTCEQGCSCPCSPLRVAQGGNPATTASPPEL